MNTDSRTRIECTDWDEEVPGGRPAGRVNFINNQKGDRTMKPSELLNQANAVLDNSVGTREAYLTAVCWRRTTSSA